MKITVFGAGYVGLVTAICLADIGHQVVCIDNNRNKIEQLIEGIPPIFEEGLQALLTKHLETKNINFTSDPVEAILHGEIIMIAVGTPLKNDDINLSYLYEVANTIVEHLNHDVIIVMKSTVPPGTTKAIEKHITDLLWQRKFNCAVDFAVNPEFLQEGTAIRQFMHPDRIIVGADKISAIQTLHDLYSPIIKNKEQFLIMDKASAELTKYASNALLATKISFINEISQIAEKVDADIDAVKIGMGMDYRINPLFLRAGCGFGGSCFPKDIMTLIATAKKLDINPYVLEAVIKRNNSQQKLLFHKVKNFFKNHLKNKTIALWGLSFKPHTDDIRCATSHVLTELFWQEDCFIKAYDPLAMENFSQCYPNHPQLELCSSPFDALENADVLVIATEWPEFKQIPLNEIKQYLRYKAVFDGRNIFHPEEARRHNLHYYGVGRVAEAEGV